MFTVHQKNVWCAQCIYRTDSYKNKHRSSQFSVTEKFIAAGDSPPELWMQLDTNVIIHEATHEDMTISSSSVVVFM